MTLDTMFRVVFLSHLCITICNNEDLSTAPTTFNSPLLSDGPSIKIYALLFLAFYFRKVFQNNMRYFKLYYVGLISPAINLSCNTETTPRDYCKFLIARSQTNFTEIHNCGLHF